MRLIALLTAAAAAATLAATGALAAPDRQTGPYAYQSRVMPEAPPPVWLSTIDRARSATWACQTRAEMPRTRPGLTLAALRPAGNAFRGWVLVRWGEELAGCQAVLARTLPPANDWLTSVRIVQRAYPGSDWWLRSCSSGEGGWGAWVWNGGYPVSSYPSRPSGSSGAGGPMQYMEGTFWHDFNAAHADLTARGFRIPASAASWYSPLGQAVAAGWAYGHHRPPGKWTGGGC